MPTDIWGNVTGGASGSVYDTVISTSTWAQAHGGVAGVVSSASDAAARAAITAAQAGVVNEVITAAARAAGLQEWRNVTGSAAGYEHYELTVLQQAAVKLGQLATGQYAQAAGLLSNETIDRTAAQVAKVAIQSAPGVAGIFGISGVVIAAGAAVVLLILLKR